MRRILEVADVDYPHQDADNRNDLQESRPELTNLNPGRRFYNTTKAGSEGAPVECLDGTIDSCSKAGDFVAGALRRQLRANAER
jgi:hypothetical protein